MKGKGKAGFLNADLEIESTSKLDTLVADLGDCVRVLHHGPANKKGYLLCLGLPIRV